MSIAVAHCIFRFVIPEQPLKAFSPISPKLDGKKTVVRFVQPLNEFAAIVLIPSLPSTASLTVSFFTLSLLVNEPGAIESILYVIVSLPLIISNVEGIISSVLSSGKTISITVAIFLPV